MDAPSHHQLTSQRCPVLNKPSVKRKWDSCILPENAQAPKRTKSTLASKPLQSVSTIKMSLEIVKSDPCKNCKRSSAFAIVASTICSICGGTSCLICTRHCGGGDGNEDGFGCGRTICRACCSEESEVEVGIELCQACVAEMRTQQAAVEFQPVQS